MAGVVALALSRLLAIVVPLTYPPGARLVLVVDADFIRAWRENRQ